MYNYAVQAVQWEVTQPSIQGPLEDLAMNSDWGGPSEYDITVTKTGEKLDTEYSAVARKGGAGGGAQSLPRGAHQP